MDSLDDAIGRGSAVIAPYLAAKPEAIVWLDTIPGGQATHGGEPSGRNQN
jgi:hypothetical protein